MAPDLSTVDPAWAWAAYVPDAQRPWNRSTAAHLYRRAGFAANSAQLDAATKLDPTAVVEQLMTGQPTNDKFLRESDELAQTLLASGNPQTLSSWWLLRMLNTPFPLLEKMTLFWHGHFATSGEKVTDSKLMLAQNLLLRQHALGQFDELLQGISRDPAMLLYLDSATNRKQHPNENFARELMELFSLGLGNYTERDIQEMARCFTGWEVFNGRFRFNPQQHDFGAKTALARTGEFNGEDAVRVVLAQAAAPRFIAGKLVRYFVCDDVALPPALIEPLAVEFAERKFAVAPVVRRILSSNLLFSEHSVGRKVRSPVELGVGLLRSLEGATNMYQLADELGQLGQAVFFPPNVKGWDGGRTWINSSTLLGRANLVQRLALEGKTRFGDGNLASLVKRHGAEAPEQAVDWLLGMLVAVAVPPDVRQQLVTLAASGDRNHALGEVVHTMSTLPEFQLN